MGRFVMDWRAGNEEFLVGWVGCEFWVDEEVGVEGLGGLRGRWGRSGLCGQEFWGGGFGEC